MELIEKLTNELSAEIDTLWVEYAAARTEFNEYCKNNVNEKLEGACLEEVNAILKRIQDSFAILYTAYNFIAIRHQSVSNAVTDYNDFIDMIIKRGAQENEPEKRIIMPGDSGIISS